MYAAKFTDGYVDTDELSDNRKLVAVEWVVKDTGQTAPTLFGLLFAAYNPDVVCSAT